MAHTTKPLSDRDASQTLQGSFNDVNSTIGVDGYLTGKVGRKVTLTIATTNVANDTEIFRFLEGATQLYEITIVYTSSSRDQMLSAERTA